MTVEAGENHMHHNPDRVFPEGYLSVFSNEVNPGATVIVLPRGRPNGRFTARIVRGERGGGVLVQPLEGLSSSSEPYASGKRVGLSRNTRVFAQTESVFVPESESRR